jgi:hypothetical protein
MPDFDADYIKALVFRSAREESVASEPAKPDRAPMLSKDKNKKAETIKIPEDVKEAWKVKQPRDRVALSRYSCSRVRKVEDADLVKYGKQIDTLWGEWVDCFTNEVEAGSYTRGKQQISIMAKATGLQRAVDDKHFEAVRFHFRLVPTFSDPEHPSGQD